MLLQPDNQWEGRGMEKRKGRGERGGEKTTLGERVVNVEGSDTNRE